ncbi:MAG: DUF4326 domain-containing protein [Rhodospirillaceae bacterium]|nr:DUF4326 domain-containing protein [Rhodospirillaceae bacterium]
MILNRRTDRPRPRHVYIGRPSKWGNPIRLRHEGERIRVLALYRTDLVHRLRTGRLTCVELAEFDGRPLVCWCAPLACHGHALLSAATWAATQPDVGLEAAKRTTEPIKRLFRRMRRHGARRIRGARGKRLLRLRRVGKEGWSGGQGSSLAFWNTDGR